MVKQDEDPNADAHGRQEQRVSFNKTKLKYKNRVN